MLIYTLDCYAPALKELNDAVNATIPEAKIRQFNEAGTALDAISDGERPDAVFSGIDLPGTDGLTFAEKLKAASPETKLIFVTWDRKYAVDAFRIHADGYLIKPVTVEQIEQEAVHLHLLPSGEEHELRVQCFGNFEVFCDDAPLTFKRRKTKEMFAYLIDRNGAVVTAEEMAAILWEDEADMKKAKHNLRNLVNDLRSALDLIGRSDVLIRGSGTMSINKNSVICDYYLLLEGDGEAVRAFRGEYMNQYHWARATEAALDFND